MTAKERRALSFRLAQEDAKAAGPLSPMRARRYVLDMTLGELGKKVLLTPSVLSRYESHPEKPPPRRSRRDIARALRATERELWPNL